MRTANENVVRALARVLADARAGNIEAVAIVACSPDGVPDVSFGGESELIPSVNLGIDALKLNFVSQLTRALPQPVAAIRRPAGAALDG